MTKYNVKLFVGQNARKTTKFHSSFWRTFIHANIGKQHENVVNTKYALGMSRNTKAGHSPSKFYGQIFSKSMYQMSKEFLVHSHVSER